MITKKCCICEKEKSIDQFHKRTGSIDGLRCDCKSCRKDKKVKNYEKSTKKCSSCNIEKPNTEEFFNIRNNGIRCRTRSLCKECHKKSMRKAHLTRRYNMSQEDYELLYNLQQGKCRICDQFYEKLFIDHNHDSGEVRELLCNNCNSGIGYLKENIDFLKNAIKYINHHNEKTN